VNDAIHLEVPGHAHDVVHSLRVWRKAGTVDPHVAIDNRIQELIQALSALIDQVPDIPRSNAGFLPDDDRSR